MDTAWHRKVVDLVTAELTSREESILAGFPSTFDDYRERVGEIRGLRAALAVMEEVSRKQAAAASGLRPEEGKS